MINSFSTTYYPLPCIAPRQGNVQDTAKEAITAILEDATLAPITEKLDYIEIARDAAAGYKGDPGLVEQCHEVIAAIQQQITGKQ